MADQPPSDTVKEGPRETIVKAPKGASKAPLDGEFGRLELRRQLGQIFNLASDLAKADPKFEDSDFSGEADNLILLVNRFPALRVVLRILGPIATIGSLFQKAKAIYETSKLRKQRQASAIEHIPGEQGTNGSQPVQPNRVRI